MTKWIYRGREISDYKDFGDIFYGFIYKIENLTKSKTYIGKKNFFSITNPEISKKKYDELKAKGEPVRKTKNKSLSKKGSVVWRYKRKDLKKETNWLTYTGSNDELNRDIKNGDVIRRTIMLLTEDSHSNTYHEASLLFKNNVLEKCSYYNSNILAKFFKKVEC